MRGLQLTSNLLPLWSFSLELTSAYRRLRLPESLLCLLNESAALTTQLGLSSNAGKELGEGVTISEGAGELIKLEVRCEGNVELGRAEARASPLSFLGHVLITSSHCWKSSILDEAIKVHSGHKPSIASYARVTATLIRCFHRVS